MAADPVPEQLGELIAALRWAIGAECGGRASVFSLLRRAPYLRPLLRDRRLLDVLRERSEIFALEQIISSTSVLRTKSQLGKVHPNLSLHVSLREPLRADEIAPARAGEARAMAARTLLRCAERQLIEIGGEDGSAPLALVIGATKQMKRAVRAFVPGAVRGGDTEWWTRAFAALRELLAAHTAWFVLGAPLADTSDLDTLRASTVALRDPSAAAERAAECDRKLEERVALLVRRSTAEHGVAVQELGQDVCVRANLGGRSLLHSTRALCAALPSLELFERPPPSKLRWAVRLAEEALDAATAAEAEARAAAAAEAGTEARARDAVTLPAVEVLAVRRDVVALSKPAGISTEALLRAAARLPELAPHIAPAFRAQRAGIPSVSRLDRPTSGVLIAPLTPRAERRLTAHFAARRVEKTYICLVAGVTPERGVIEARLYVSKSKTHFRVYVSPKGKPAVTRYTRRAVLRVREGDRDGEAGSSTAATSDPATFSLLEVSPLTGRTHQIRAHFASIGHPLVSDTKYKVKRAKRQMAWCPRLFLHAFRIVVPMGWGGEGETDDAAGEGEGCGAEDEEDVDDDALVPLVVEAPLPDDLAAVLAAMEDVIGSS